MEVTEADIARIPPANVRVPRAEFVAVWTAAEREVSHDWHAVGVAMTCRWLATSSSHSVAVNSLDSQHAAARIQGQGQSHQTHPHPITAIRLLPPVSPVWSVITGPPQALLIWWWGAPARWAFRGAAAAGPGDTAEAGARARSGVLRG